VSGGWPRSWLYAPGDRPERFAKAAASGADAVILDLEDGVAPDRRAEARANVAAALRDGLGAEVEVWVRVDGGDALELDLAAAEGADVIVAKADVRSIELAATARRRVCPLLETAASWLDARSLASHDAVTHLALGEADLGADMGLARPIPEEIVWPLRLHVVAASAAAGVRPPTAPVWTDLADEAGLLASTLLLRRAGFGGRTAVHPSQVAVINEVFTPTQAEMAEAEAVVAAHDAAGGGVAVDAAGRLIDAAVVRSARLVLLRGRR
jgi:citrate lyase subunit beta/citryl-CoA lyase